MSTDIAVPQQGLDWRQQIVLRALNANDPATAQFNGVVNEHIRGAHDQRVAKKAELIEKIGERIKSLTKNDESPDDAVLTGLKACITELQES